MSLIDCRQYPSIADFIPSATILQYALTLEHLENAFYREAIAKFSQADFEKAGLKSCFLDNLKQIKFDEQTHVDFLSAGLTAAGATPVAECTYAFGLTDVPTFLAIANVLEGVGVSAYLGAAKFVKSPDYLTAAGSILTVESRHSAYLRENQTPALSPFPSPFDIALGFNDVFSLAAPFITACPAGPTSSLEVLKGFKAFPAIAVSPAGTKTAGEVLTLAVNATAVPTAKGAWFVTSGGYTSVKLSGSGSSYTVTVPEIGVPNLKPGTVAPGQAYLILTKDDKAPTDDNTAAGPAVFEIADNAFGRAQCKDADCKPVTVTAYPSKSEAPKGYPTPSKSASTYESKPTYSAHPAPSYSSKSEEHPSYTTKYETYTYTKSEEHKPTATYSSKEEKPTYSATHPAVYPTTTTYVKAPEYKSTSTSCTEEYAHPTGY